MCRKKSNWMHPRNCYRSHKSFWFSSNVNLVFSVDSAKLLWAFCEWNCLPNATHAANTNLIWVWNVFPFLEKQNIQNMRVVVLPFIESKPCYTFLKTQQLLYGRTFEVDLYQLYLKWVSILHLFLQFSKKVLFFRDYIGSTKSI